MEDLKLRQIIMRRVWYSYGINIMTNPAMVRVYILLSVILILQNFVSFANVFRNLSEVKVGEVPAWFLGALVSTEIATIFFGLVFLYTAVTLVREVWRVRISSIA